MTSLHFIFPEKVSDSMLFSRPTWEGGQYDGDEQSRLAALRVTMELGADHIDVELKVSVFLTLNESICAHMLV